MCFHTHKHTLAHTHTQNGQRSHDCLSIHSRACRFARLPRDSLHIFTLAHCRRCRSPPVRDVCVWLCGPRQPNAHKCSASPPPAPQPPPLPPQQFAGRSATHNKGAFASAPVRLCGSLVHPGCETRNTHVYIIYSNIHMHGMHTQAAPSGVMFLIKTVVLWRAKSHPPSNPKTHV